MFETDGGRRLEQSRYSQVRVAMTDVKAALKNRRFILQCMQKRGFGLGYLDLVRSVQPAARWKVMVVDSRSVKLLDAAVKMYEILEENVTCTSFSALY